MAITASHSKTLMSKLWQKTRARKCNTRQGKSPTPHKEATNSIPQRVHSRPKCTTSEPNRATCIPKKLSTRPNVTTTEDGNQNVNVETNRAVGGQTVTDQAPTTGIQTKPKTTKPGRNITHQHQKYRSHLKTHHANKTGTTSHKSSYKPKNRNTKTTKKKRHYIVPFALRQVKKLDKKTVVEKSYHLNGSTSQPRECILVQHRPAGQRTLPMTSSHITAYSLDNSNIPEDLLTQYINVTQRHH